MEHSGEYVSECWGVYICAYIVMLMSVSVWGWAALILLVCGEGGGQRQSSPYGEGGED